MSPATSNYRFTKRPLTTIYGPDQKKRVARVFLGEWMKLLNDGTETKKYVQVQYRGGKGWVAAADIGPNRMLEVYFITGNQGDAIFIQTPDDRRILIDGGPDDEALHFIRNKYRLDKERNYVDLDAVVLTHTDEDHAHGMLAVLKDPKIGIKRVYHNGLFPNMFVKHGRRAIGLADRPMGDRLTAEMRKLAEAIEIARTNLPAAIDGRRAAGFPAEMPPGGLACIRADASLGYLAPFDRDAPVSLQILWPEAAPVAGELSYPWFTDGSKTKNGNSVVLRLVHEENSLLLSGDLNAGSMESLLARRGKELEADVYKVPHHGSDDSHLEFLKAVSPNAAVITSADDANSEFGHPRAITLGTVTRYSRVEEPAVFCTELAACYTPLRGSELASFRKSRGQLYARSNVGVVHMRSDGHRLCLGRVYSGLPGDDRLAARNYKWDYWQEAKPHR